ncbi:KEOPS complex subunit Pcc1 [Candidatus Pyrohabitans sp.]
MKSGRARIELCFDSENFAEVVHAAVLPEVHSSPANRARASFKREGCKIILEVSAADAASLRASLSSFMRWLKLAVELGG